MHVYLFSYFIQKGGEVFLLPFMHIYLCLMYEHSLNILMFIAMHELRGSFYEA